MTDNNKETWEQLEKAIKDATEIKTPEMTVDLPHEQKLTFGNLKPNTIVEIATWRGVGAPDQDSVRMLIGASLQPTDDTPEVVGQIVPELEGPVIPQSQEVIAAEEKAVLAPSAPGLEPVGIPLPTASLNTSCRASRPNSASKASTDCFWRYAATSPSVPPKRSSRRSRKSSVAS
jgi:hypothetical protein